MSSKPITGCEFELSYYNLIFLMVFECENSLSHCLTTSDFLPCDATHSAVMSL